MRRVKVLFTSIAGSNALELEECFTIKLAEFGEFHYGGWITMSAEPFGARAFLYFAGEVDLLGLFRLLEYSQEIQHGYLLTVVTYPPANCLSEIITLEPDGEWLDMIPPRNVMPLDPESQGNAVEDWIRVQKRLLILEMENKYLRGVLNSG